MRRRIALMFAGIAIMMPLLAGCKVEYAENMTSAEDTEETQPADKVIRVRYSDGKYTEYLKYCEAEYEKIKDIVLEELKVAFKPEFLNRVDDIIVFNQLKEEDTLKIVNLMLNDTISRLKEKNIDLIYEEDLNKFLINKNKNLEFGARPLRGIINREIVDKLSDELLKGEIKVGDKLKVECKDEILVFSHR